MVLLWPIFVNLYLAILDERFFCSAGQWAAGSAQIPCEPWSSVLGFQQSVSRYTLCRGISSGKPLPSDSAEGSIFALFCSGSVFLHDSEKIIIILYLTIGSITTRSFSFQIVSKVGCEKHRLWYPYSSSSYCPGSPNDIVHWIENTAVSVVSERPPI